MSQDTPKRGLLLVNLGTPDAPTEDAIRRYLKEFLSDPKVVTLPRWLWLPILNGLILRTRPSRLVERYRDIWTAPAIEGGDSPIRYFGEQLATKVESALEPLSVQVASAMTYGKPTISDVIGSLISGGVREVLAIPLFPQYTDATTGAVKTAIDRSLSMLTIDASLDAGTQPFELSMVDGYHDHPDYVEALCQQLEPYCEALQNPGCKLLLSYHGIPVSQARQDPYLEQCGTTSELIARTLELDPNSWEMTFQSRFGPMRWLSPYTDERIRALGGEGVRHLIVACPGFAVDCLETLEEINVENRGYFLAAGGTQFTYVPALNADESHVAMLASIAEQHWSRPDADAEVRVS